MALRTHNLLSGLLKNDFGENDEATFEGIELIFNILIIE
jgi:hypothetical protein